MEIESLGLRIIERSAKSLYERLPWILCDGANLPGDPERCPLCQWFDYLGETFGGTVLPKISPARTAHVRFHESLAGALSFGDSDPGRMLWFLGEAEAAGRETIEATRSLA